MNLLEIWIGDLIKSEPVNINGVKKIKVTFETNCWGAKEIKTRIFNSLEDWEKFKARRYYLG